MANEMAILENRAYIALIRKTPDWTRLFPHYSVEFPDVPGCVITHKYPIPAHSAAQEALSKHIAMLHAAGERVPVAADIVEVGDTKDLILAMTIRPDIPENVRWCTDEMSEEFAAVVNAV